MEKLGRYKLLRKIGSGGMADVFLSQLDGVEGFKRELVIKRMKPTLNDNNEAVKMFLDEARLSAKLNHPHIVQVTDLGESDGSYFIAMEYVAGLHLGKLARRAWKSGEPPSLVACAYVVHRAASGLHCAHEAQDPQTGQPLGIVHRDISPHNILLSRFGDVKVADFGVAKSFGRTSQTRSGVVKGKVSYMSPEQVLGKNTDPRSDIFALGIVLFEICTGRRLFKAKTDLLTLQRITEDRIPVPSTLDKRIDTILDGIILRCLAQDPDERYPTMEHLEKALGAWIDENARSHVKTELSALVDRHAKELHEIDAVRKSAQPLDSHTGEIYDVETQIVRPTATLNRSQLGEPDDDRTRPLRTPTRGSHAPMRSLRAGSDSESGVSLDTRQFGALKTNLTPHGSRFIGRTSDLQQIKKLFDEGAQLVTVHGSGGTGKTRLALRYAERHLPVLSDEGGGAWFCDLTVSDTADGIAAQIANALGIALDHDDTIADIARTLEARGTTLIILDNFEHLVRFAKETVGRLVSLLPMVRFLVTSREVLHVPGEICYQLAPMGLPERGKRVESCESVQLFLDRAKAVRSDFVMTESDVPVIAEIVERLDGIPLAIELAAARVKVLRPRKLLERLSRRFELLRGNTRDTSPRQATLRATIDWSWELLEPSLREALSQCAIFRGGFSLEAAEHVVDLSEHKNAPMVLDALEALRDKSLLRVREVGGTDDMRFDMYESIREYAREKLHEESDVDAVGGRHATYFLEAGAQWAAQSNGHEGAKAIDKLALDARNLRQIHQRVLRPRPRAWVKGDEALRAVSALCPLYEARGPRARQLQLLNTALEHAADNNDLALLRAEALRARGRARRRLGRIGESRADFANALRLARMASSKSEEARVLRDLGILASDEGRLDDAERNYRDALQLHEDAGDRHDRGITLAYLGFHQDEIGKVSEAAAHYQSSLEILRDVGDKALEGLVLGNWAGSHQESGDIEKAERGYRESIRLLNEVKQRTFVGPFLGSLATILHERGALDEALIAYDESFEAMRETGNLRYLGLFFGYRAGVLAEMGDVDNAELALEEAENLLAEIGDPRHLQNAYLQRAFLDLALAARAFDRDDELTALDHLAKVDERIQGAHQIDDDSDHSAAERSDDVRKTLRLLAVLQERMIQE